MFHFPAFPPLTLCVQTGVTRHDPRRVSPFGHPRINAWLAAPRGLSQPPTSFIGFWRLGIHHVPFVTWQLQRCSRSLCSSQGSRPGDLYPALPDVPAGSGPRQSLVARCSRPNGDAPSKLNSVCGRVVPDPAVPHPSRGGTERAGERPDRIASDRPWSDQAVRSWPPGDPREEGRGDAP